MENQLREVKARNDLLGALSIAEEAVAKFPGNTVFRSELKSLERASETLRACQQLSHIPLDSSRGVRNAQELIDEAKSALRTAGMSADDSLEAWEKAVKDAESELEGVERIKQQMFTSLPRAIAAALCVGAIWALGHLLGAMFGSGESAYSSYLWTRNGFVALGLIAMVVYLYHGAWGITAPLVAILLSVAFALLLFIVTAVGGYWPGMILTLLGVGTATWLFESGMEEKDGRVFRMAANDIVSGFSPKVAPKRAMCVSLGMLALFLAAGSVGPPESPAVEEAFAEDISTVQDMIQPPDVPQPPDEPTVSATIPKEPPDDSEAVPEDTEPPIRETTAPTISASVSKLHPIAGEDIVIELAGATNDGDEPRFEWRHVGEADWQFTPSRLIIYNVAVGVLKVELRSFDVQGNRSNTLKREWDILPRPTVRVRSIQPTVPIEHGELQISLESNRASESVKFECRDVTDNRWRELKDSQYVQKDLPAATLFLQFRCRDQHGNYSDDVNETIEVRPLTSFPLDVSVTQTDPETPFAGGPMEVKVNCQRPSQGLVYKFREPLGKEWSSSYNGTYEVSLMPKGEFTLQYGVVDTLVGDHSDVLEHTWDVVTPRYKVDRLTRSDGRLLAVITDVISGNAYTVGVGDEFEGLVVVWVSLSHKEVVIRARSGWRMAIDIPAEEITRMRTIPKVDARTDEDTRVNPRQSYPSRSR